MVRKEKSVMSSFPDVHIFSSAEELATASAQALKDQILTAIKLRDHAHIVLTGGSNGIAILAALKAYIEQIDWNKVSLYFGDERFVPSDDSQRNAGQAHAALLQYIPQALVYSMPASDQGVSLEQAAKNYEQLLITVGNGDIPQFDVHLFGVGEEGHINSLFPYSAATQEDRKYVVAVKDSPKPPAERITLTFPAIAHARQTWFLVAGENKADAVAHGVAGKNFIEWPDAGAHGSEKTVWFLDSLAASKLHI